MTIENVLCRIPHDFRWCLRQVDGGEAVTGPYLAVLNRVGWDPVLPLIMSVDGKVGRMQYHETMIGNSFHASGATPEAALREAIAKLSYYQATLDDA